LLRKVLSVAVCTVLGLTLFTIPAAAKSAPVTKLKFKLDAHEVTAGTPVTGGVYAWSRDGSVWEPIEGAELTVKVDGVEVGTLFTDTDGYAAVSYLAVEGEHVMKIVFAGDGLHKRAQRAQGFTVTPGDPVLEPAPEPAPAPAPAAVAPDPPVLTGSSPSAALAHLGWTVPVSDGGSAITSYNVYRGDVSGEETLLTSVSATSLGFDDTGVFSRQILYYVVTAVNAAGESVWSNEVEIGVQ
jgi:hypothetical protein